MKALAYILFFSPLFVVCQAPFSITVTNPAAEQVLRGNYAPAQYLPSLRIDAPAEIACLLHENISPDSLRSYLLKLGTFHNRNTYSDTLSNTTGIGAARRWTYQRFQDFSAQNENRLIASYLQFDMPGTALCGSGQFRNIFAALPGADTSDKSIVIIEAHLDTRCEDACDIHCLAEGADDNGSGTALVLELARVMSKFTFQRTIVFLVTIGEEQGLFGAEAFAKYLGDNGIPVRAVQNNDIVGGIVCGETSSPPSCPAVTHIDSAQVRIFSAGLHDSKHKSYARFVKTMYQEWLLPLASVPMTVSIMQPEDRTGRGGDHIPFRQRGITAVRFSSANEHGHGDPSDPSYHDRQHSTRDILGVDTDGDSVLDSFFVDFNYLARNTAINGMAAAMAAAGPQSPAIQVNTVGISVIVTISDPHDYRHYRIGVRRNGNDFEAIYTVKNSNTFSVPGLQSGFIYRISAAAVNSSGAMSLFSNEVSFNSAVNTVDLTGDTLRFGEIDCASVGFGERLFSGSAVGMRIHPNPFSEATQISIFVDNPSNQRGQIMITDILGKQHSVMMLNLNQHHNSVSFSSGNLNAGIYFCSLFINGALIQSKKILLCE